MLFEAWSRGVQQIQIWVAPKKFGNRCPAGTCRPNPGWETLS